MVGHVYMINAQGSFRNDPHPHVVLAEFEEECLVMPCFSTGGKELEETILDAQNRENLHGPALKVELDNRTCVTWHQQFGRTGNQSCWLPWRMKRISKQDLPRIAPGRMCDECMGDVLAGAHDFAQKRPRLFSKKTAEAIESNLMATCKLLAKKQQRPTR
jgi:hypothetical protein